MTLNETAGQNGINEKFMIQYSTYSDFSADVHDVVATSSCISTSKWCYGDGVDTDDDPISTLLLLGDSTAKGRHNEAATTTSTMSPLASTATEFEFTLKQSGAQPSTTYFFRAYDVNHALGVPLAAGASYPSLATYGGTLDVTVAGIATSTVTEGVTTDIATDATSIPFGTVAIGSTGVKAAQRITVSTNATEGYQVFLAANASMLSSLRSQIPDVTGTNAAPSSMGNGMRNECNGVLGLSLGR